MAIIKYQEFRNLRKRNLYTTRELGEKLGVSGQLVLCWEIGKSKPKLEILPEIAKLLNTNVTALLNMFYGLDLSEN